MKTLLEAMGNLQAYKDKRKELVKTWYDLRDKYHKKYDEIKYSNRLSKTPEFVNGHFKNKELDDLYIKTLKAQDEYFKYRKSLPDFEKRVELGEEFINNITDEEPPKILYHFTGGDSLLQILRINKMRSMENDFVSFTSDETYGGNGFQPMSKTTAVLVFDADKMSKDYDIERYVYLDDDSAEFDDYVNEHEWVIKGDFDNISKYLLYIGNNGMSKLSLKQLKNEFPDYKIEEW